jgi:magnesium chelatase family protein
MLAWGLTTILAPITLAEYIETRRILPVAHVSDDLMALVTILPFGPPHHMISGVGLSGGG